MNYEPHKTQDARRKTRDGFTLIEMVVAIGLLVIIVLFAGAIFKASIGSYRVAMAQAEIMRKLRVITEQFNSDFKGLRKDAPLFIWFRQDPNDPNQRFDQIMFFADGDFQSTRTYGGKPVVGNVARIYYGQARSIDPRDKNLKYPSYLRPIDRILTRRQHILTADANLVDYWPSDINTFSQTDPGAPLYTPALLKNDTYEYDWLSLSQWQVVPRSAYDAMILNTCFDQNQLPVIDTHVPITLHNLFCENVGLFSIQWAYADAGQILWFPSNNPDGSGAYSHFVLNYRPTDTPPFPFDPLLGSDTFGAFFNMYQGSQINYWGTPDLLEFNLARQKFVPDFYPTALKFTFTLYDSRGVFKEGQTFTHIVYLGD